MGYEPLAGSVAGVAVLQQGDNRYKWHNGTISLLSPGDFRLNQHGVLAEFGAIAEGGNLPYRVKLTTPSGDSRTYVQPGVAWSFYDDWYTQSVVSGVTYDMRAVAIDDTGAVWCSSSLRGGKRAIYRIPYGGSPQQTVLSGRDADALVHGAGRSIGWYSPDAFTNPNQNDPLRAHYLPNLLDAEGTGIQTTYENYTELGYRGFLQSIADNVKRRVVNYHNRSDYWLATGDRFFGTISVDWVTWQRNYKPFQVSWVIDLDDYQYAGWNELIRSSTLLTLRPVRSPYEAMAFIARSRTRAVGGEPAPDDYGNGDLDDYREGGPAGYPLTVQGQRLDLKAVYGFGSDQKDHSGQFLRNIQELYSRPDGTRFGTAFYRQLMEDLQVVP